MKKSVLRTITVPYHNFIYNRLPEDEPSFPKHVGDIKKYKNLNIYLENVFLLIYIV